MNTDEAAKRIKYILLPAPFMSKGFIEGKGAPTCNYEEYLAELLNESVYFRQRTNGNTIMLTDNQDHGRPDIDANGFSLDLKLIGGESAIAARRLTSQSITHLSDGVVAYGIANGKREQYEAVHIHLALRNYSCDELISLRNCYTKKDVIQRDIVHLLNNLTVDKNLLLFLPYAFIIEDSSIARARRLLTTSLDDCFSSALEYRKTMVPKRETFFCCIHNQQLLVFLCRGAKLEHLESINTSCSKSFIQLARYYDLNTEIVDAIIDRNHLWK